jgi:hypothetical protein
MSSNIVTALIVFAALMLMGGMVYAKLFGRAANDRRGGWLFGMSFGFLIWMIGPASFLQLWTAEPMARGVAAMGLFGAHVVHGLVLGMIYPLLSAAFAADLGARPPEHPAGVSKQ